MALFANLALVFSSAWFASCWYGPCLVLVHAMRYIVVFDMFDFLACETVLANSMLVRLREEATLIAKTTLFDASFRNCVPKHSQRAGTRFVDGYRE